MFHSFIELYHISYHYSCKKKKKKIILMTLFFFGMMSPLFIEKIKKMDYKKKKMDSLSFNNQIFFCKRI